MDRPPDAPPPFNPLLVIKESVIRRVGMTALKGYLVLTIVTAVSVALSILWMYFGH